MRNGVGREVEKGGEKIFGRKVGDEGGGVTGMIQCRVVACLW